MCWTGNGKKMGKKFNNLADGDKRSREQWTRQATKKSVGENGSTTSSPAIWKGKNLVFPWPMGICTYIHAQVSNVWVRGKVSLIQFFVVSKISPPHSNNVCNINPSQRQISCFKMIHNQEIRIALLLGWMCKFSYNSLMRKKTTFSTGHGQVSESFSHFLSFRRILCLIRIIMFITLIYQSVKYIVPKWFIITRKKIKSWATCENND